jgi:hypothetical protein
MGGDGCHEHQRVKDFTICIGRESRNDHHPTTDHGSLQNSPFPWPLGTNPVLFFSFDATAPKTSIPSPASFPSLAHSPLV